MLFIYVHVCMHAAIYADDVQFRTLIGDSRILAGDFFISSA